MTAISPLRQLLEELRNFERVTGARPRALAVSPEFFAAVVDQVRKTVEGAPEDFGAYGYATIAEVDVFDVSACYPIGRKIP